MLMLANITAARKVVALPASLAWLPPIYRAWHEWGGRDTLGIPLSPATEGCTASACTCFQGKWCPSVQLCSASIATQVPNSTRFGRGLQGSRMQIPYKSHKNVELGKGGKPREDKSAARIRRCIRHLRTTPPSAALSTAPQEKP